MGFILLWCWLKAVRIYTSFVIKSSSLQLSSCFCVIVPPVIIILSIHFYKNKGTTFIISRYDYHNFLRTRYQSFISKTEFWITCIEKKKEREKKGPILTLNGILKEFVSQIRDFILSDIIQYLRDLQITVEEYFLPVVGLPAITKQFVFPFTERLAPKQYEE